MRRANDLIFVKPPLSWWIKGIPMRGWAYLAAYAVALIAVALTWPSWWPN